MNTDKRVVYIVSISLVLALSLLLFVPQDIRTAPFVVCMALGALAVPMLIKKRNVLSIHKNVVCVLMLVISLLYVMLLLLSGLYFGYMPIGLLTVETVLETLLPGVAVIVCSEIIRSILMKQDNKLVTALAYLLCVYVEFLFAWNEVSRLSFYYFMDVFGMTLCPAITANILYCYIAKRYGTLPNLAYRIPVFVLPYLFSLKSAIPEVLLAFVKLLLPLFILFAIDLLYRKRRRYALERKSGLRRGLVLLLCLIVAGVMMVISCQFRFGTLVIASESMSGEIEKGDAIVYERYDKQQIVEGQVIVFHKNNTLVVHRVAEIRCVNGLVRYYTKGDANDTRDVGYITDADVLGITHFRLPYVGYPTLWLRSIFN